MSRGLGLPNRFVGNDDFRPIFCLIGYCFQLGCDNVDGFVAFSLLLTRSVSVLLLSF